MVGLFQPQIKIVNGEWENSEGVIKIVMMDHCKESTGGGVAGLGFSSEMGTTSASEDATV